MTSGPSAAGIAHPLRRVLLVVAAVLALPVLTVVMICWHECAHTVAAWIAGDPSARFVLVSNGPDGGCVGCNVYDSALLGPGANAFVNAAGVLGTQLLAWSSLWVLARARPAALLRILLGELLALTVVGDLVFQTVQAVQAGVPAREPRGPGVGYVDGSAVASFAAQATGLPIPVVAGLLLLLVGIDLLALLVVALLVLRRARRRRRGGMPGVGRVSEARSRIRA